MRFFSVFAVLVGASAALTMLPEAAHSQGRQGTVISFYQPCGPAYYAPSMYYAPSHYYAAPSYYPAPSYYAAPRSYAAPSYYPASGSSTAPGHSSQQPPMYPPQPPMYPGASGPAYSAGRPTTTVTIGAHDSFFKPSMINVQPGTTVRWVNLGKHTHTVTSSAGLWDSGDLAPGAVYSATFFRPGTYYYYCRHHGKMQGTIVVGSGDYARSTTTGY